MIGGTGRGTERDAPNTRRGAEPSAVPDTAMVLAAGLGERMMPLTLERPKPLIEVAGRSLIDRTLDRLEAAGVRRAVVNLHHLGDLLEAHLSARRGGPEIIFSDERRERLETGGGVKRAAALFDCDPVLVVNSDALWTDGEHSALERLAGVWDESRMDALLLVIRREEAIGYSGPGDFALDSDGRLQRVPGEGPAPFVYAGIQLLSLAAVERVPEKIFPLAKVYDSARHAGRLFGVIHDGGWAHVGTPQAIDAAARLIGGSAQGPH